MPGGVGKNYGGAAAPARQIQITWHAQGLRCSREDPVL